jgi:hypothetical protein
MVTGRRFPPPWHVVEHAGNRLIRPAPAATPNLEERTALPSLKRGSVCASP